MSARLVETSALGERGPDVTRIGFGAWGIGGIHYGPVARDEALGIVEDYLDAGGNLIDTALVYGESEDLLGEALVGRGDVTVVSKTPHTATMELVPGIREDLETTLSRLGRDRVDVYLMHQPPQDPVVRDAVLDELEALRDEGLVGQVGASIGGPNVTPDTEKQLDDYVATGRIEVVELIVSVARPRLLPAIERCRDAGVGVIARTVFESGFLTGRYRTDHAFGEGDHRHRWGAEGREAFATATSELDAVVEGHDLEGGLAEAALRFPLAHPGVSTVIAGATTRQQMRQNVERGARGPLPRALQAALEQWGDRHGGERFNP